MSNKFNLNAFSALLSSNLGKVNDRVPAFISGLKSAFHDAAEDGIIEGSDTLNALIRKLDSFKGPKAVAIRAAFNSVGGIGDYIHVSEVGATRPPKDAVKGACKRTSPEFALRMTAIDEAVSRLEAALVAGLITAPSIKREESKVKRDEAKAEKLEAEKLSAEVSKIEAEKIADNSSTTAEDVLKAALNAKSFAAAKDMINAYFAAHELKAA